MNRGTVSIGRAIATPAVGPLVVLVVFCAIFSLSTHTFFAVGNLSLVIQQSVIVGTLAIGQTMIILTGGIDLANGAVAVLGTIVAGRMVNDASQSGLLPSTGHLPLYAGGYFVGIAGQQADVAAFYRDTRFARHCHRVDAPDSAGRCFPGN